jgi:hypothetical protein
MIRIVAAMLLAATVVTTVSPAACLAQAAEPFPEVPLASAKNVSHRWSHLAIVAGAGMIGSSFILADHANHTYDEYLAATDPAEIAELYDRTVRYDRLASAALLGGEVMVAVGLYARFLRPSASSRLQWSWTPSRCAIAWRF